MNSDTDSKAGRLGGFAKYRSIDRFESDARYVPQVLECGIG
jgi:hypothetical protein